MREVATVEASCLIHSSSKINSSTVFEVTSTTSSHLAAIFADDFNNGETEAIRVVDISYISSQFRLFEELFPTAIPVVDACHTTSATLPYVGTLCASSLGQLQCLPDVSKALIGGASPSLLHYALQHGARQFIISSEQELETLYKLCVNMSASSTASTLSDLEVMLRLKTVSHPFGAEVHQLSSLLQCAARLSLPVFGLALHCDISDHVTALHLANDAIGVAANAGVTLKHVHVSGGIPRGNIELLATELRPLILQLSECGVAVSFEAGEFLLRGSASLFLQLYDVREMEIEDDEEEEIAMLWLVNEGVLGCFKDIVVNDEKFDPQIVTPAAATTTETSNTRHVLVGCDGGAMTVLHAQLPFTPTIGAWIRVNDMGCAKEESVVVTRHVRTR